MYPSLSLSQAKNSCSAASKSIAALASQGMPLPIPQRVVYEASCTCKHDPLMSMHLYKLSVADGRCISQTSVINYLNVLNKDASVEKNMTIKRNTGRKPGHPQTLDHAPPLSRAACVLAFCYVKVRGLGLQSLWRGRGP